jgi:RNA polymerase I-specific transcription initiation factor RRN6
MGVIGALIKSENALDEPKDNLPTADILALGTAKSVYAGHDSSLDKSVPILAMSHGEAGHILRLVKPRVEKWRWTDRGLPTIRMLNPDVTEDGYWMASGGKIEQIVYADDTEGNQSWLAVRKQASTTIFMPVYNTRRPISRMPSSFGADYPPSRVDPNPALTITSETLGGSNHADVAFNPWYPRQFVILDDEGYFRIWDIEGRSGAHHKKLGKTGHLFDDLAAHDIAPDMGDGWGRIFWAGNVSTVIVCNRKHFAAFDMRSRQPARLNSPKITSSSTSDYIMDARRSAKHLNLIFVLTSSRILLLDVVVAGDRREGRSEGVHILTSCHHVRGTQQSLKMELIEEDGDTLLALYSAEAPVVNIYRYQLNFEGVSPVTWSCDAFTLRVEGDMSAKSVRINGLQLRRTKQQRANSSGTTIADEFLEAFILDERLGLHKAMLAVQSPAGEAIAMPTEVRVPQSQNVKTLSHIEDDFIVPDGVDGDHVEQKETIKPKAEQAPAGTVLLEAQKLYELATTDQAHEQPDEDGHIAPPPSMSDYIQNITGGIQHRKQLEQEGTVSLAELAGYERFTEDIDDGASLLQSFLRGLAKAEDTGDIKVELRSTLMQNLVDMRTETYISMATGMPDLAAVYDRMVELWVTSLPKVTPGLARLAKERVVRTVAAEVVMNSVLIQTHKNVTDTNEPHEDAETASQFTGTSLMHSASSQPSRRTTIHGFERASSSSRDRRSNHPQSSLPTPDPTEPSASTYYTASLAGDGPSEDPATLRLRAYALSIKSQKPLGAARAAVLAHWPSVPGSNPDEYQWAPGGVLGGPEEDEDSDAVRRREKLERRERRKTEKLLKRSRESGGFGGTQSQATVVGTPGPSQSAPFSQYSQGAPQVGVSTPRVQSTQPSLPLRLQASQGTQGMMQSSPARGAFGGAMTQPMGGAHGSRLSLGGFGGPKKKKRKTGF